MLKQTAISLPSSGSVFAFGHEDRAKDMRARIVIELALNEELYLSHQHLQKGIDVTSQNLPKTFAMYSNQFTPGVGLSANVIKAIYEHEVMEIRKPNTYMGI
jgi:hypothetical protein